LSSLTVTVASSTVIDAFVHFSKKGSFNIKRKIPPFLSKEDIMGKLRFCRGVSYKKKANVYVFYADFNYIFFRGAASLLVEQLIVAIDSSNETLLEGLPNDFIGLLLSKNIIEEVSCYD
jgi:hypothetical protein